MLFFSQRPHEYNFDRLGEIEEKLILNVNVVLDKKWNRVRRGELVYRATLFITVVLVLFFALPIVCLLVKHYFSWFYARIYSE